MVAVIFPRNDRGDPGLLLLGEETKKSLYGTAELWEKVNVKGKLKTQLVQLDETVPMCNMVPSTTSYIHQPAPQAPALGKPM